MKLLKYDQFAGLNPMNEDVQRAKKLLKDRYLINTISKDLGFIDDKLEYELSHGDKRSLSLNDFNDEQQKEIMTKLRETKLSEQQVKDIEKDPDFRKIRTLTVESDDNTKKYILDRDNQGWVYMFTYFYFIENISLADLKDTYSKLIRFRELLDNMPKKLDQNFIDPNIPNNYEILIDGIDIIDSHTYVRDLYNILNRKLKDQYNKASKSIKDKFDSVAKGFKEIDEKQRKSDLKNIARKMGRYNPNPNSNLEKNLEDFIIDIANFLKSANNVGMSDFLDKLDDCNDKFGNFGADIAFNENGILVIEVKSFNANVMLNSNTSHCIKDSISQWNNYVGENNKQYYIYDFNIPSYEKLSVIGVTIQPNHTIRAAHAKGDEGVSGDLVRILSKKQSEYNIKVNIFDEILLPITQEEMERRRKAKEANIKLSKGVLSIDEITELVGAGGDINIDNSKQLNFAVIDGDYQKIVDLLNLGAKPIISSDGNAIINNAKDLKTIKLLIEYGSEITPEVFENICDDPEAVKFCLDKGIDPDFGRKSAIRRCIVGSWESQKNNGEPYLESIKLLTEYGGTLLTKENFRRALAYGRIDVMNYMLENGYIDEVAKKTPTGSLSYIKKDYDLSIVKKMTEKKEKEVMKYLDEKIKLYE